MDTSQLFQTLNSINILGPELRGRIAEMLREEQFSKRSLLLKEGTVSQRIYFIKEGCVRAYYLKNGQQFTNWFMQQGDIIISVYSFFSRKPSFENIEALDDCIVQSINWDQLQQLYREFVEFNITGRIITEQYYIRSEERAIALQTLTGKARYEQLLYDYPQITQYATLGQIASYLGIKQETLSRIRAAK